jgi:hypothetical protein
VNPTAGSLSIELSGVPQALSLPTEAKENCLVTTTVRGGTPSAVWLARSADSPFAVPVQSAGEGRYQLNLADAQFLLAMRRSGPSGQCHIFVKDAAGTVIQSAPICFELRSPASATFCAYSGKEALSPRTPWLESDRVTEVQVALDPSLPGVSVTAQAADQSWALKPNGDDKFSLVITPEIRKTWRNAVRLQLSVKSPVHSPSDGVFLAIPHDLTIPAGGMTMAVPSNATASIPGSWEYLQLHCGEVTPTYASLDVTRADQQRVDPELRIGHCAAFRLHDQQYAYGPDKIDYGGKAGSQVLVHIWSGAEAEDHLIRELLSMVRSDDTIMMTFNKRDFDCTQTAALLEELYVRSGAKTIPQLLDALTDREKTTGSACKVSISGHTPVPLRAWAIDKLVELGWTPPHDPAAAQPAGI